MIEAPPVLEVDGLVKAYGDSGSLFGGRAPPVQAVAGVSFKIARGETLALVGESGCGKSSIGRVLMQLTEPTDGRVLFQGRDLFGRSGSEQKKVRQQIQMVFQDPFGSLNPRKTIHHILSQPLKVARGRGDYRREVLDLLNLVGMRPAERFIDRLPHEFSGGQRQRIAIARAFALRPSLIVADEPVSALDVSVRAQILRLMRDLQREMGAAYLFITHDLGVVRAVADRVAVMYLGKLVESGPVNEIFSRPTHPYTEALLSASPVPEPNRESTRIILAGDVPSPTRPPPGCRFHTRCPIAQPICRSVVPRPTFVSEGHWASCHVRAPSAGIEGSGAVAA